MPILLQVLIAFLFVVSGITSLVYESLWIRVLSLGVGSTSASISMVLSIFFFGLSAGSFLTGKYIHRIKNPLLFYGIVEAFIGVYSFGLIYVLLNFHELLVILPLTGTFSWVGTFFKFFFVFLLLLAPTLCMGASLPLLVRIFVKSKEKMGRYVSILYGINTLGAVIGAFITGFFLIPQFGVLTANHVTVAVNILILGVTFLLVKKYRPHVVLEGSSSGDEQASSGVRIRDLNLSLEQKWVLLACGVCGFSSIASQVVWSKYLGIFFGTNIFGLGLILSLFLFGIAFGAFFLSFFIGKIKDRFNFFVVLLICSIFATLTSSYLFNFVPTAANVLSYYFGDVFSLLSIKSFLTVVVLFLPTCLFGMLLPLGINLLSDSPRNAPFIVGLAYSVNTVGSILGSYLAGLVIIPLLGSSHCIRIAIVALCVTAVGLVFSRSQRTMKQFSYVLVTLVLTLSVFVFKNVDFRNIIKSAYYQYSDNQMTFSEVMRFFSRDYEEFKLIHEGKTAIISLSHDPEDGEDYKRVYRLKTNGLNESIYSMDSLDELPKYEALLGFLPYAYAKKPENAFVVGYGGGFSVDLLTSLDLKKVHVVELEKGIIRAANYVYQGNNPILKRENLDLRFEDARFVLAAQLYGPYDIIISQPSHSWLSGVANLFTLEFFEIVKENLSEKGVYSQWLNLYNMNVDVLRSILKTFYSVFPHGVVYTDRDDQELIMLGSMKPLSLDVKRLDQLLQDPMLQTSLTHVGATSVSDFLTNYSLSRSQLLPLIEDARLNTDINAYAEVNQSTLFYSKIEDIDAPQRYLSENYTGDFSDFLSEEKTRSSQFYYDLLLSLQWKEKYDKFLPLLEKYEAEFNHDKSHTDKIGFLCLESERFVSAKKYLQEALVHKPSSQNLNNYLSALLELREYREIPRVVKKYRRYKNDTTQCFLGHAYTRNQNLSDAKPIVTELDLQFTRYQKSCGDFLYKIIGSYYYESGNYRRASRFLEDFYNKYPSDVEVIEALVVAFYRMNNRKAGAEYAQVLDQAREDEVNRLIGLSERYRDRGLEQDADFLQSLSEELSI